MTPPMNFKSSDATTATLFLISHEKRSKITVAQTYEAEV